jgi:hypothetical protein
VTQLQSRDSSRKTWEKRCWQTHQAATQCVSPCTYRQGQPKSRLCA